MLLAKFRGIALALALLAGLWALFLVSAHLLLDFEQTRGFVPAVLHFKSSASLPSVLETGAENLNDGNDTLFVDISEPLHQDCNIPEDEKFPDCYNQVKRLRRKWVDDVCYKEYDVDGTDCSILIYLSEVESWCPRLSSRKDAKKKQRKTAKATLRVSPDALLSQLKAILGTEVLQRRISDMWKHWEDATSYVTESKANMEHRNIKKILVFVGDLADVPADSAPEGKLSEEMIQWSDLLAALFVLGHDVKVSTDKAELLSLLSQARQSHRGCSSNVEAGFDLIYIDMQGLQDLVQSAPDAETTARVWDSYRCRFRVFVPFGMDAEFDYQDYEGEIQGETPHTGKWDLQPRQFLSKFPLSPDNSFLGFAIASKTNLESFKKKGVAFVHTEHASDLKKYERYLKAVYSQGIRLHSASDSKSSNSNESLPQFVVNLDLMSADGVKTLLEKSKILLGLKMPYEGILPLEAIARGCVFINPKFVPSRYRLNSKSLRNVPSFRKLSSQHPYAHMFIGEPHVFTIDIGNLTEVYSTLQKITKSEVSPHVPFEFTSEGMLERLNAYIENQDFCGKNQWPPDSEAFEVLMGEPGDTCTDLCFTKGLVCEPQFFQMLNSSHISDCSSTVALESPIAPAMSSATKQCIFQSQPLLYSCAGGDPDYHRFCPCRTYSKGQIALCKSCF